MAELPCSNKTMTLRSIQDVSAKITFNTANIISSVTCRLEDENQAIAGGITSTAGFALNQLGTSASDTTWRIWFDDFSPTDLGLTRGTYYMYLLAVDGAGDKWEPCVRVRVA